MSRAKLKPCPFCGCSAWLYEHKHIFLDPKSIANGQCTGYRVECEGMCHAMTYYWHTKKEAVEKWNTRTPAGQGKD